MSEMLTQWPVLVALAVGDGERDADGALTADGVARLFAEARAAYAAACPELDLDDAAITDVVIRRGVPTAGSEVLVGVAVVEVFPDTFTMDLRIRPASGAGIAGSASCVVAPSGGVGDQLRSRLIALAQTARHLH